MDRNWDQDHFNTRDLDKIVVRIHVCAYVNESNAGDEEGNQPTNHWAIFLELADQNSVRLDMAPGYGSDGLRGKIEVASKRYQMTMNAIYSLSFDVAPGVTVRTITDLISSHKRQKYTFTKEWEGCRFWIYTVMYDLEAAGIVAAGSAALVWQAVSCYWRYPGGCEQREVRQGTFRK